MCTRFYGSTTRGDKLLPRLFEFVVVEWFDRRKPMSSDSLHLREMSQAPYNDGPERRTAGTAEEVHPKRLLLGSCLFQRHTVSTNDYLWNSNNGATRRLHAHRDITMVIMMLTSCDKATNKSTASDSRSFATCSCHLVLQQKPLYTTALRRVSPQYIYLLFGLAEACRGGMI